MKRTLLCLACLLMLPVAATAQQQVNVGTTFGQIAQAANAWIPTIMSAATRLFFLLAAIDFAWSAPHFLRENDFMGLFLSLIKKLLVVCFFYAVLVNGQVWIPAIVNSFIQIGSNASGLPLQLNPSDILASGLQICGTLLSAIQGANLLTNFGASLVTVLMVVIVFAAYLIITLHYVVTKLEAIIVMTAGYLFLGFGGSRWTMPYFERYIALAISTGTRLMLIYLMLGVFGNISATWAATMQSYDPSQPATEMFPTLAAMLLFAFASWMIPKMAGSIASGSLGLGGSDLVQLGATAATGAVAGAATVAALSAAPFTGGGSLAAEGALLAGEGATAAEGAALASEAAAGASGAATASAAGAADTIAGGSGIPAPVPPPPADLSAPLPIAEAPAPTSNGSAGASTQVSSSAGGAQSAASESGTPKSGSGTGGSDIPSNSDSTSPLRQNRPPQRRNYQIPDDGSDHHPPPQLRIDGEE